MNHTKAEETTIKIIATILHLQNGYSKEKIKSDSMAEDCKGHELFEEIKKILLKVKL